MVLIAGGESPTGKNLQSAELYDPAAGTFTATGSMSVARQYPTATLLPNSSMVLIAGGGTASAELFDPAAGIFAVTGTMWVARSGHTATLLANGTVLIAGGGSASAELYK
jgi:hypothetical protein